MVSWQQGREPSWQMVTVLSPGQRLCLLSEWRDEEEAQACSGGSLWSWSCHSPREGAGSSCAPWACVPLRASVGELWGQMSSQPQSSSGLGGWGMASWCLEPLGDELRGPCLPLCDLHGLGELFSALPTPSRSGPFAQGVCVASWAPELCRVGGLAAGVQGTHFTGDWAHCDHRLFL